MSKVSKPAEESSVTELENTARDLENSLRKILELHQSKLGDDADHESKLVIWLAPTEITDFKKQLPNPNFNFRRRFADRVYRQVQRILECSDSLVFTDEPLHQFQFSTPGIAEDFYRVGCHLRHAFNTFTQEFKQKAGQRLVK